MASPSICSDNGRNTWWHGLRRGTFDAIERVIEKDEERTAFIRAAVEREIARRQKKRAKIRP